MFRICAYKEGDKWNCTCWTDATGHWRSDTPQELGSFPGPSTVTFKEVPWNQRWKEISICASCVARLQGNTGLANLYNAKSISVSARTGVLQLQFRYCSLSRQTKSKTANEHHIHFVHTVSGWCKWLAYYSVLNLNWSKGLRVGLRIARHTNC